MRALFLTWDGPHQSYLESLFFPIFARLRGLGVDVHVLQLTWATEAELLPTRRAAQAFGVSYTSRAVSRRFGLAGNVAAIARGARLTRRYVRQHGIDVLFPRSLLPASMALLAARALPGVPLVFDADGLMADERLDFGGWKRWGAPYRVLRAVEAATTRAAVSVITRTADAKQILLERAGAGGGAGGAGISADKIFVIPNAKDAQIFRPGTAEERRATRARHGVPESAPWLVYSGSLGPQYRPEVMLELFLAVAKLRPDARFSLFTFHEPLFRALLERRRVTSDAIQISRVTPAEMPACLAAADLGLAFRAESFSQRAICPIKVAEYLQCGVPVVATRVGDLAQQLDRGVAFLADDGDASAAEAAAAWFVAEVLADRDGFRARGRELGERVFGLESCAEAYRAAFERVRALRA